MSYALKKNMKQIAFLISFLCCSGYLFAQTTLTVEVQIKDVNAGGEIRAALCADENSFKTEVGCVLKAKTVNGKTVTLTYTDLAPGTYALKLYQDVDGDEKLGTNAVGIPNEPFGFSNNAMGNFGPPSFEQASFTIVKEPQVIKIKLRG
ncbi:MAG: DUF2141 domain-containing protein [Flavobacteriales bacterium]